MNYKPCDSCGKTKAVSNGRYMPGGKWFCRDCFIDSLIAKKSPEIIRMGAPNDIRHLPPRPKYITPPEERWNGYTP